MNDFIILLLFHLYITQASVMSAKPFAIESVFTRHRRYCPTNRNRARKVEDQGWSQCLSPSLGKLNNSFETPKVALASLATQNRTAPAAG